MKQRSPGTTILSALALCATSACTSAPSGEGSSSPSSETGASGTEAETGTSSETGDGGPGPTLPLPTEPGEDAEIVAFDDAHVFWLGWEEGQNQRQLDVTVDFPDPALGYTEVELELTLGCPNGLCDWWDRKGYLGVVENPGDEEERIVEIARVMTPYRVGGTWTVDVTELRPLLAGERTLRLFIDTWVGPGHANGDGWLVDASFRFTGGLAPEMPVEVMTLLPEKRIEVGDPAQPLSELVPASELMIPAGASRVQMRNLITGHGQGNAENCAEFCVKQHGFLVNDAPFAISLWRDDCGQNPIDDQAGNWRPSRAGWCPGDTVDPWIVDVTEAASPGSMNRFEYAIEDYENTCRPDAPTCTGCTLGTGCDYDGGAHTPPEYRISSTVIIYASE